MKETRARTPSRYLLHPPPRWASRFRGIAVSDFGSVKEREDKGERPELGLRKSDVTRAAEEAKRRKKSAS
ncbi:uncharacterized protein LMH87_008906 [Akanthomyces muscarius]|uniref:Uncharacterized protein n=1 Tax=Akanthomyces muscarius TaxID=2231603 RepID=A0A9W8UQ85_AKAMU|nr:uncharacterized protein LMH87_008906 [Akanthomyces muscarius]KAJ4158377.1 hypothetical protein LMH87_008906 [Akanthomyces muscarius]